MSVLSEQVINSPTKHERTRPRLLALSFYYPPANNPRAVQVHRLLHYIHLPTVLVCADYDQGNDRMDHAREASNHELVECLRVPYAEAAWRKFAQRFIHRFDPLLIDKRPDKYVNWKPAVVKTVDEFLKARVENPDVLVTFGSPMSDHVIGLELKRRLRVPWIAHFSDPWVDNIFKNFNWLTRSINVSLERKVIETADRLIFTSAETLDLVMRKYPAPLRSKSRVLPHAFEIQSDSLPVEQSDSHVIRYVGDMYGRRTPRPLFKALHDLLKSDPDLLSDVRFEFVGSMHDLKLDEMGLAELPPGLVNFHPTVSYEESLALMFSAAGLLVIDAPAETSVFLPSKLIDYVGVAKPIFGITPPGTAARLISELGGWVSDPSNKDATRQELASFVRFVTGRKDFPGEWGNQAVRAKFDARVVAKQFECIVSDCF